MIGPTGQATEDLGPVTDEEGRAGGPLGQATEESSCIVGPEGRAPEDSGPIADEEGRAAGPYFAGTQTTGRPSWVAVWLRAGRSLSSNPESSLS